MIDLQRFCANELDEREYLHKPWKRGQWVYATNGHVCVRVPAEAMPDVGECDKAPAAERLFMQYVEGRQCDFLLMPKIAAPMKCHGCNGRGAVMARKCPSCTDGTFDHYGHTYDCLNCADSMGGPGWIECEGSADAVRRPCNWCSGLGADMSINGNFRLGDAGYSVVYLHWLAKLPQVRVCPGTPAHNAEPKADIPAVFIFDGGHALLMPRRD